MVLQSPNCLIKPGSGPCAQMSVALWLKILDEPSYDHETGGIITTLDTNEETVGSLFNYSKSPYKVGFRFNTIGNTYYEVQSFEVNKYVWYHFVVVLNSFSIDLYQDGSFVKFADGQSFHVDTAYSDILQFGRHLHSSYNNMGKFVIDELLVYDTALSTSEVEFVYYLQ